MGDLSEHFSLWEFACPCCGEAHVSPRLIAALEELHSLVGAPILISSGYRCPSRNRAVGGAEKSQHLKGRAADIVVDGVPPEDLAEMAEHVSAFDHGGIGVYDTHLHVDVRGWPARWYG